MIVLLRCPQCGQHMKFQPRGEVIGKTKRCVYCGRSFVVNRERISRRVS